ncbi:MAG: hypothetical protein ACXW18_06915 [Pyrinomonadaceae bacterium]
MKRNVFDKLTAFLTELEGRQISYTLSHNRDEAIMINVAAPGERWEIEFLEDGSVEVERFISNGAVDSEETLRELFARYRNEGDEIESSEHMEVVSAA